MNSQCSCLEEAAQSHSCAVEAPAPCSDQNSQVDPCACQGVCPSCPCECPPSPAGMTCPPLPLDCPEGLCAPGPCVGAAPTQTPSAAAEPFTIETPGMCVMTFPLQKSILTVELCPPDTPGMCLEPSPLPQDEICVTKAAGACLELAQELPAPAPEPCTLEVLEVCEEGTIPGGPCASQSGNSVEPSGPCQSQGLGDAGAAEDTRPRASSRAPFRLNSCTSSIVERCLSRCQSWFRGKK